MAAAIAYATTPVAIFAARRLAFYDSPFGYKGHSAPTPYLGGAAVMAAFAIALLVGAGHLGQTLPLLAGLGILWLVGTIDDRRTVSPQVRVAVEVAVAIGLTLIGRGWHLHAGFAINAVVNSVWVVGVINAFNLFDNMDGAASTMGLVVAGAACALGWLDGNDWAVPASAALCGACMGFLPHNLSRPAKIFLGDGGSMPLGFAVAVLVSSAARGAEPSLLSLLTGLLLIGLPALDTTMVIVSRRRRRISIFQGAQDHLTHRTAIRLRSTRRVALVLGVTQALISALVILATRTSSQAVVYTVLGFVVCAVMAILWLEQMIEAREPAVSSLATPVDEPAPRAAGSLHALWWSQGRSVGLLVLGLGAGLSPFLAAYYNLGVWIAIGFILVILAALVAVVRPPQLNLPAVGALTGLAGLGIFSLISTAWASGAEQATIDGNRWLALAAFTLLVVLLIRRPRDMHVVLAATGVGILAVAVSVVARMLGSDPTSLFLGGRLNAPLSYVNGEGCVFAMGCWLALAAAERREPLVAAGGAAAAVLLGSLVLLSQSRGAAIAVFAALLVTVAALPGRPRRIFALTLIGGAIAAAAHALLHVYSASHGLGVPVLAAHDAARAALIAAVSAGTVWGLLVWAAGSAQRAGSAAGRLRRLTAALAALIVIVPCVAAFADAGGIERSVRRQWHAFVHLSEPTSVAPSGQTRLLSGGGNRYDYWRIAWSVFRAHPLAGVGAGNYTSYYYRARRTQEAIQNPHSVELQTLSELGLIGGVLLLLFVGGVVAGAIRFTRDARAAPHLRTPLVAASGIFVVWLVNTSGDWIQLLPGATGVALIGAAVLCRGLTPDGRTRGPVRSPARPAALAGAAGLALVLTVAGASLLRQGLAHRYLVQAQHELASRPAAAIGDARSSLRLDGANLDAYYVEAAGEARFDQAASAKANLLAAAREDPQEFVTWVLLGDLEVRLRDYRSARRFYGRAHRLDPNDPSIASLATNPAAATSGR